MKLLHLLLKILASIMMVACSSPKFTGFETKKIQIGKTKDRSDLKSNYMFQMQLLRSSSLDNVIYKALENGNPVIVSNYNLYPFNLKKAATDSTPAEYFTDVDENINSELSIHIEKQLLSKGFDVLENEKKYNLFDNNFDEYGATINFEILRFGIYYEKINKEMVIRHGVCEIRYKVLNKLGYIKAIKTETNLLSDTVAEENILNISAPPITLSFTNTNHDRRLTDYNSILLGGIEGVRTIESNNTTENPDSLELITGLKFLLPNETKNYSLWIFDNKKITEEIYRKGSKLNIAELINLRPVKVTLIPIKSNLNYIQGSNDVNVVSVVSTDQLNDFFKLGQEIVVYYKAKRLCILKKFEDGTIQAF
jgi:hypothetical protein